MSTPNQDVEYYNIPKFRMVYSIRKTKTETITTCQVIALDDGEVMSFGTSKLPHNRHYQPELAKKLAHSKAMFFLFMKAGGGAEIPVIDEIDDAFSSRSQKKVEDGEQA